MADTQSKRARNMPTGPSPFTPQEAAALAQEKFRDPLVTAKGEARAHVGLHRLETLWFNTGSLCNLACATCFMESSATNDALVYLTAAEVARFMDEADADFDTREIGFTGGEPFMNPEFPAMLGDALDRGYDVLVLSNAMKPMRRHEAALETLKAAHGSRLTIRVSLDHHTQAAHEGERGANSWAPAIAGLRWLSDAGFSIAVAGRHLPHEDDATARAGYAALFAQHDIRIDAADPARLVLFPEMDETKDVPEITTACWGILDVSPRSIMCSSSRMVVRRKGAQAAAVVACTLLPYDAAFEMGTTLAAANHTVSLNHPHCARFCVLGGASCS